MSKPASKFTEAERTALANLEKSLSSIHRWDCDTFNCMNESGHPAIEALVNIVSVAIEIDILAAAIARDLHNGLGAYPLERLERLNNRLLEAQEDIGKEYEFVFVSVFRACFDA